MKRNPNLITAALCCAMTLGALSADAQVATNGPAKVIRLKGAARASTGNFRWHEIKAGDVLWPGTVIQTSATSETYVDLALGEDSAVMPQPPTYQPGIPSSYAPPTMTFRRTAEQNVIRLWGDGALVIDRLSAMQTGNQEVTDTQLDLKRGRLTGNVKKLSAGSKYEIKFNNGVAGVRGTVFDMQAAGIIKVYIGSMVVAWVDPRTQNVTTQTVTGGQGYDAASNQLSPLSMQSMNELGQISLALLVMEPVSSSTTLAVDRTVIGMSPVGASAASVPAPIQQQPSEGGVFTTYPNPPPIVLPPSLGASRSQGGPGTALEGSAGAGSRSGIGSGGGGY